MDDLELLKLAAEAAGIDLEPHPNRKILRSLVFIVNGSNWNPLLNNGDALQLAVKTEVFAGIREGWAISVNPLGPNQTEPVGSDPAAALRRVIVRAAADIARYRS